MRFAGRLRAVHIFTMADSQYQNHYDIFEDVIHDAIVSNANAICVFLSCHFSRTRRVGAIGKSVNSRGDPNSDAGW